MTRTVLPIAVLPLDAFGERITVNLRQRLRDADDRLVENGWCRCLPVWDGQPGPLQQEIMSLLAKGRGTDPAGDYTSASPGLARCMLVVLMSMRLSETGLCDRFCSLLEALASVRVLDNVILLPIIDVSVFPEEPALLRGTKLVELDKECAAAGCRVQALLVDGTTQAGVPASSRETIGEAVALYLEATVLGDHWGDLANAWFAQSGTSGMTVGSLSVVGLCSPTADIRHYLERQSFHEVVDYLDDAEGLADPPAPTFGTIAYEPALTGAPMPQLLRPGQLVLMPKSRVLQGLRGIRERFEGTLDSWQKELRRLLPQGQRTLATVGPQTLRGYERQLDALWHEALQGKHPLAAGRALAQAHEKAGVPAKAEGSPPPAWEPLPVVEGSLASAFRPIDQSVARLPNPPSLIAHMVITVLLQAAITSRLVLLWSERPEYGWLLLIGFVALWVLGFGWLAWRLPSGRICMLLRGPVCEAARTVTTAVSAAHRLLWAALASHWSTKTRHVADALRTEAIARFSHCREYLLACAKTDKERYPSNTVDGANRAEQHPFVRRLGDPQTLGNLREQLHCSAAQLAQDVRDQDGLVPCLLAGDALGCEGAIRAAVTEHYAEATLQDAQPSKKDVLDLLSWWRNYGGPTSLWLRLPPSAKSPASKEQWMLPPTWRDAFDGACGPGVLEPLCVDVPTSDRGYLVYTVFGLSVDGAVQAFAEENR